MSSLHTTDSYAPASVERRYELRFQSLYHSGRARSFPCDATGSILWDTLSERARSSLADVQAAVGREFGSPSVMDCGLH